MFAYKNMNSAFTICVLSLISEAREGASIP